MGKATSASLVARWCKWGKNLAANGRKRGVRVLQAAAAQMGKKGAAHVCITGGSSTDVKKTVAAQMGKKEATTHA